MPGPGGGSHGGGGGRSGGGGGFSGGGGGFHGGGMPGGGFHGGGHHGGFHGGGHRPHFHGPHFGGGWFHRPHRHYGGGGGCFGGVIVLIFIVFFMIYFFGSSIFGILGSVFPNSNFSEIEIMKYDENSFQDYANSQYKKEFGSSTAYEDNILLVFLADTEECYDYYYIAWVGDHIHSDINYLFGDEYTEFGQTISECINTSSYKYSLDSNIADVVKQMETYAVNAGLESSFTCEEDHAQVESHLTNKTTLDMTEETVNSALQSFTEKTGIPIVVVVDDIEDIFPSQSISQTTPQSGSITSTASIIITVILAAVVIAAIVLIIRKKKRDEAELED